MEQASHIRIERFASGLIRRAVVVGPGFREVELPHFYGHAMEQSADHPPGTHSIAWPANMVKVVEVEVEVGE